MSRWSEFRLRMRLARDAIRGRLTSDAPTDWATAEYEVGRQMRQALVHEIERAREIEALAFDVMSRVEERKYEPVVFRVHVTLLARVLFDLRSYVRSALAGYTMQAWAMAASAFEAAHMSGWIGVDAERAQRWLDHDDLTTPVISVYDSIRGTTTLFDLGSSSAELDDLQRKEYILYEYLCMAKHVNPVPERNRYWAVGEGQARLTLTPVFSDTRVREARLGFALGSRAAIVAIGVVAKAHLEAAPDLERRLKSLARSVTKLIRDWGQSTGTTPN